MERSRTPWPLAKQVSRFAVPSYVCGGGGGGGGGGDDGNRLIRNVGTYSPDYIACQWSEHLRPCKPRIIQKYLDGCTQPASRSVQLQLVASHWWPLTMKLAKPQRLSGISRRRKRISCLCWRLNRDLSIVKCRNRTHIATQLEPVYQYGLRPVEQLYPSS